MTIIPPASFCLGRATKLVPAFLREEGREMDKVKALLLLVLVVVSVAIVLAIRHDLDGGEEKVPTVNGAISATLVSPNTGRYIVQTDDNCEGIAELFTGDPGRSRELFAANSTLISQEASNRAVLDKECPIQAGWELTVPGSWIPGGAFVQYVPVNDDWPHWKRTVVFGVLGGIAFGYFLRWTGLLSKSFRWARNTFRNPAGGRFKKV